MERYSNLDNALKLKKVKNLISLFDDVYYNCIADLGTSPEANYIKESVQKIILLLIDFKDKLPVKPINTSNWSIDDLFNALNYSDKVKGDRKVL